MKVKDRLTVTPKCRLCLPEFSAEDGDDSDAVSLINEFCKQIEHEIISYTESEAEHIRLYTSEYTAWAENKFEYLRIRLSVRKNTAGRGIDVFKRELLCKWCGSRLIDLKATDI